MTTNTKAPSTIDWSVLEGKFFHILYEDEHKARSQGQVLSSVGDDYFMVELFEWFTGSRSFTGHQIFHISDMTGGRWVFYEDDEAMREAHEYGGLASR